ncbi:solute carrier organic anion transporter family member 4A1-like [Ornithodoros turicata]|uniref:solute carrier organic anion transporter family member 4A1-like n=1 Tax=Ornithodoros turicata TaxID=34597 RepID=UPI003139B403
MTLIADERCLSRDNSTIPTSRSNEPLVLEAKPVPALSSPSDEDAGGACGWACLTPGFLQRFRTPPWVLFFFCWAGFLQGLIVNGFVNVVITTIERRFQLRSSESGLIASGYDIASFLLLVPISYFGGTRSKPLFIGLGSLVLGLGALVFAMPHFVAPRYSYSTLDDIEPLCYAGGQVVQSYCRTNHTNSLNHFKYVFLVGQMLHGAGATPFFTLGCTYLDEIVSTKMSSVYIGIFYTMAIIGPAMGYILGGQFLKIYTDVGANASLLGLTTSSGVWVGAWWLGFVVSAFLAFLAALPISAFPKILPGSLRIQAQKKSEMHQKLEKSQAAQSGFGSKAKDLPASLAMLILNPTFAFLSLAGATEGMLVSGLATFLPKVIEFQFSIAASYAALIIGAVTVPGAGGGTFLGGYLVKKFNLRCAGIIKMCILCSLIAFITIFTFVFSCPNVQFAGVHFDFTNNATQNNADNFISHCNNDCQCHKEAYDPVCGTDNIMYYSPCHAGCQKVHHFESTKVYEDCRCINHLGKNMTINGMNVLIQAERNKCSNNCNFLVFFLLGMFICMLFTFLVSMPSLAATLRCVAATQKSFGLGIQWITVRLIGTIPAPILFGYLIDSSCVLWPHSCDDKGACAVYENGRMARNLLILLASVKFLSCLFFFLAWLLYKPPEHDQDAKKDSNTNGVENVLHQNNTSTWF